MAGALWVLDYMFTLASNGCSGVNMETGVNQLGFISSYSPIGDDEQRRYSARPEYYGMVAFSLGGHGDLLPVEVDANTAAIKAYATRPKEGALVLHLNTASEGREASVLRMNGPAVDAKTGITLGGAEVTSSGTWKPAKQEPLPVHKGQVILRMPAFSAAMVTFLPSNS